MGILIPAKMIYRHGAQMIAIFHELWLSIIVNSIPHPRWWSGNQGGGMSYYNDVIMSTIASKTTSLTIVYSTVYSGTDESKHQRSASLAFVWGIHRWPGNSPYKGPVTRKTFPFDDVIMVFTNITTRQWMGQGYRWTKIHYYFQWLQFISWRDEKVHCCFFQTPATLCMHL